MKVSFVSISVYHFQSSVLRLMTQDAIPTSKSIEDSGVDVGAAVGNAFITSDSVDSSCLLSDAALEWIFDMAMGYVAVVEGSESSGFFGLFFGILNFLTSFQLLDVPFTAIASVSSFDFKKKATKCELLLLHKGSGIQRVAFIWDSNFYVGEE